MKLQTTRTGKSYLLIIEQANEIAELPRWIAFLSKQVIIIVPKKPIPVTTHTMDGCYEQPERDRVSPSMRCSEVVELCAEPPVRFSWRHVTAILKPLFIRRYSIPSQEKRTPLTMILIVLVLLALVCAALGLLLFSLGTLGHCGACLCRTVLLSMQRSEHCLIS